MNFRSGVLRFSICCNFSPSLVELTHFVFRKWKMSSTVSASSFAVFSCHPRLLSISYQSKVIFALNFTQQQIDQTILLYLQRSYRLCFFRKLLVGYTVACHIIWVCLLGCFAKYIGKRHVRRWKATLSMHFDQDYLLQFTTVSFFCFANTFAHIYLYRFLNDVKASFSFHVKLFLLLLLIIINATAFWVDTINIIKTVSSFLCGTLHSGNWLLLIWRSL